MQNENEPHEREHAMPKTKPTQKKNRKKLPLNLNKNTEKLLDIELPLYKIEALTNLFAPFALENCPEGLIVTEQIKTEIENMKLILSR